MLAAVNKIIHTKRPSPDYASAIHEYEQDGMSITESVYRSLTNAIIGSMSSVILREGKENEPIWDKTAETDSLAMSYDSAAGCLKRKIGSETADRPLTGEEAVTFMVPVILEY